MVYSVDLSPPTDQDADHEGIASAANGTSRSRRANVSRGIPGCRPLSISVADALTGRLNAISYFRDCRLRRLFAAQSNGDAARRFLQARQARGAARSRHGRGRAAHLKHQVVFRGLFHQMPSPPPVSAQVCHTGLFYRSKAPSDVRRLQGMLDGHSEPGFTAPWSLLGKKTSTRW
jgi:hypothetical protein